MEASETTKKCCALLHPKLLQLVKQCLLNDFLNTQGCIMEVKRPRSSSLDVENSKYCDRFILEIPYCGTHIPWEVIFDRNHLGDPPDIIFSIHDDLTNFSPSFEQLSSLSQWNVDNERCLVNLLEELLEEYRHHHRNMLAQYERLSFQLDTLVENGGYSDVSVHCHSSSSDNHPVVRFFIPLHLDSLSHIPAYFTEDNPGPDKAALVVQFSSPSSKPIPFLHISPRLERMLGGYGDVHLPPWGGDNVYVIDYVLIVHQLLQERLEAISQNYVQRKEYTAACLSIMGSAILEYDTEYFKTMAFLFENQGFSFIGCLNLSDDFPSEQPSLTLQSVYHKVHGVPCQSLIINYPYSPRWNAEEMAERIRSYIMSVSLQFMELSQDKGDCLS